MELDGEKETRTHATLEIGSNAALRQDAFAMSTVTTFGACSVVFALYTNSHLTDPKEAQGQILQQKLTSLAIVSHRSQMEC